MSPKRLRELGLLLASAGVALAVCIAVSPRTGYAQTPGKVGGVTPQDARRKLSTGTTSTPPAAAPALPAPLASADDLKLDHLKSDDGDLDDHSSLIVLHNWVYTQPSEKLTIRGATARLNRKADTLDTDDPVVIDDDKHHITADRAHIEHVGKKETRSLRFVVLDGHVVMVLKPDTAAQTGAIPPAAVDPPPGVPAPDGKKTANASAQQPGAQTATKAPAQQDAGDKADKDREQAKKEKAHGGTATCDRLEYKTTQKFSTLSGHVVFTQHFFDDEGKQIDRKMTCEHAENDDKANQLHLFKPVHYEDSENQTLQTTDDVLIGTKDGEEKIKLGQSIITFPTQSDDEEDNSKKDSKTAPDKGAKKPPK